MSEYTEQSLYSISADLLMAQAKATDRYNNGSIWARKLDENKAQLARIREEIADLIACVKHLDDIYHNIEHYSAEHQRTARDILMRAIEEAGALVPDANVNGVHLQYDKDHVVLVTKNDQSVNDREGGGYRTILGVLLRYALLKAQPGALQFMLLDEQLFTLSDVTTALLKEVLDAMKRDCSIIMIEQRRNAADGISDKEYYFQKSTQNIVTVSEV